MSVLTLRLGAPVTGDAARFVGVPLGLQPCPTIVVKCAFIFSRLSPSPLARPIRRELTVIGFLEGSGNVHRGQGTANRRVFFENAMLELIWVCDEAGACAEAHLGP